MANYTHGSLSLSLVQRYFISRTLESRKPLTQTLNRLVTQSLGEEDCVTRPESRRHFEALRMYHITARRPTQPRFSDLCLVHETSNETLYTYSVSWEAGIFFSFNRIFFFFNSSRFHQDVFWQFVWRGDHHRGIIQHLGKQCWRGTRQGRGHSRQCWILPLA